MRISEMNWMMVEEYLGRDDRAVLPLGCTEQHAYLSLSTDSILAERLAVEAAEPLGIPVFPVLAYGITPYFRAFPGTITLRVETYMLVLREILDAMSEHGFKQILIVNGHGGNTPAQGLVGEWIADHPDVRIKFHNWWNAPKVWAQVQAIDPVASHASWMENFPGFLRAITSQRAALGRARSAVSYPHQVGARERAKNINASSAGTSNLGFGKVLRSQNAMAYHPLSFDA